MKHIHSFPAALTAIALALAAGSADAQIVNGNFSQGTTGWTIGGDDDGLVLNLTGNAPLTSGVPGGLEDSAGLPAFALDPDKAAGIEAVEGSVASQTFTTSAGGTLSFSWDLATMDTSGIANQADVAFVVVDGKLTVLGNILGASHPADAGSSFAAQTGWAGWSTTLAGAGTHTIAFGVADIGDYFVSSALDVGNVSVSTVPESSGFAMLAAGLGLLALQARRRRHR